MILRFSKMHAIKKNVKKLQLPHNNPTGYRLFLSRKSGSINRNYSRKEAPVCRPAAGAISINKFSKTQCLREQ